jgi:hypothetical protein
MVCSAPSNGSATCSSSGSCGFTCASGYHACNGNQCAQSTSVNSCGTSCTPCPTPANGTATCNGQSCGFACNSGYNRCGSACVAESVASCGSSCTVCPAAPAHGAVACQAGGCVTTCDAGYALCGGACVAESLAGCGQTCQVCPQPAHSTGAACSGGACVFTCDAGYRPCHDTCVPAATLTAIAAGGDHTCGLTDAGAVKCWGDNTAGALGNGATTDSAAPVDVAGLDLPATQIGAGFHHTCAVLSDGTLRCWGSNDHGQLGNGTTTDSSTPVTVTGLELGVHDVGCGSAHSCAILDGKLLRCFGNNSSGQIGNSSLTNTSVPVNLTPTITGFYREFDVVAPGPNFTCGTPVYGSMFCWGDNTFGQLGTSNTVYSPAPQYIGSGYGPMAASRRLVCSLSYGAIYCWGTNVAGAQALYPTLFTNLNDLNITLTGGDGHICMIGPVGVVQCWGSNSRGQLGDGTTVNSPTPVPSCLN